MATRHSYPTQSIFRNYALSITGILASLICLIWFDSILLIDFVFIGFIGLCMVAAWRSLLRQRAMVMCDEYNITLKDIGQVKLEWHKIDKIRLAFFSLRSDQQDGWMRLTLKSEQKSIKIDSQIEKFYTLADRAARAAQTNGVTVDALTRHNFRVLGLFLSRMGCPGFGSAQTREPAHCPLEVSALPYCETENTALGTYR